MVGVGQDDTHDERPVAAAAGRIPGSAAAHGRRFRAGDERIWQDTSGYWRAPLGARTRWCWAAPNSWSHVRIVRFRRSLGSGLASIPNAAAQPAMGRIGIEPRASRYFRPAQPVAQSRARHRRMRDGCLVRTRLGRGTSRRGWRPAFCSNPVDFASLNPGYKYSNQPKVETAHSCLSCVRCFLTALLEGYWRNCMRCVGVLALALALGLAGAAVGQPASSNIELLSANTPLTTASGATFTAPAGWSVTSGANKRVLDSARGGLAAGAGRRAGAGCRRRGGRRLGELPSRRQPAAQDRDAAGALQWLGRAAHLLLRDLPE